MKIPLKAGVYLLRASNTKIIYVGSTNNLSKRILKIYIQIVNKQIADITEIYTIIYPYL